MSEVVAPQGLSERTREALRRHLMRVTPVVPTAESAALAERADREETEALARMKAELEEHLRRSSGRAVQGLPPPQPAPWQPREGDTVETLIGGKCVKALVVRAGYGDGTRVRVQRVGHNESGRPFPSIGRSVRDVRLVGHLDPVRANIYADWLEEHGELRAAAMLREAFPLG